MKQYQIWTEGYMATGEAGNATLLGSAMGNTFKDACINHAKYDREFAYYFDVHRMTYWGCHLFDNLEAARESFG